MQENASVASVSPDKTWRETWRGRMVIIAGIIGLFVLVFWMARKSRRMLSPPLVVDERYLSFGEVWEDPAFVWPLPIRNTTNEQIEIAGFASSCPCGKIEPPSLWVPAQETREVRLSLDLRTPSTEKPDFAGKDFKVAIQPWIRKGNAFQPGWVVQGKVKQPFAFDPAGVDFEESLIRGQPFAPRAAIITSGREVVGLTAACDWPFVAAKVSRVEKNPCRFRLEVLPRKDMPSGVFNHNLRIYALMPNKHELSGTIPVMGRVLEDVRIQPESLTFGAKPIGAKVEEMVVLSSRGGRNFDVQEIDKGKSRGITVARGQKRKKGSQNFLVSLSVKEVGNRTHTIYFRTKTPEGRLNVPLIVSGCGVRANGSAEGK